MTNVIIDSKTLKELQLAQSKLNALEAGGVDNWEWYDESLKSWHKENDYEEALEQCIDYSDSQPLMALQATLVQPTRVA